MFNNHVILFVVVATPPRLPGYQSNRDKAVTLLVLDFDRRALVCDVRGKGKRIGAITFCRAATPLT